jgi:hypothetical protein
LSGRHFEEKCEEVVGGVRLDLVVLVVVPETEAVLRSKFRRDLAAGPHSGGEKWAMKVAHDCGAHVARARSLHECDTVIIPS